MWVGKRLIELTPHFLYFYSKFHWQSNLTAICQPRELHKVSPSLVRLSGTTDPVPRTHFCMQVAVLVLDVFRGHGHSPGTQQGACAQACRRGADPWAEFVALKFAQLSYKSEAQNVTAFSSPNRASSNQLLKDTTLVLTTSHLGDAFKEKISSFCTQSIIILQTRKA